MESMNIQTVYWIGDMMILLKYVIRSLNLCDLMTVDTKSRMHTKIFLEDRKLSFAVYLQQPYSSSMILSM